MNVEFKILEHIFFFRRKQWLDEGIKRCSMGKQACEIRHKKLE